MVAGSIELPQERRRSGILLHETLELNLYLTEMERTMTTIDDVFGGSTLKAADLQGKTVPVTIESFEIVEFSEGKKVVLSFVGKEKVLVCNKTNARTIGNIHGEHLENWIGKQIKLFQSQTDFQGKSVPCIRVQIEQGVESVPALQRPPAQDGPKPAHDPILDDNSVPF